MMYFSVSPGYRMTGYFTALQELKPSFTLTVALVDTDSTILYYTMYNGVQPLTDTTSILK